MEVRVPIYEFQGNGIQYIRTEYKTKLTNLVYVLPKQALKLTNLKQSFLL